MPDLPKTRRLLEESLEKQQSSGYTLSGFYRDQPFTLSGGKVSRPDASVCWYSAGKPVVSAGVLRILEDKPDSWDWPMHRTFPELEGSHLGNQPLVAILTHQTSLRFVDLDLSASDPEIFRTLARANPADFQLQAGQPAYDPRGGWWLLAQWIARQTNRPWRNYLHDTVLAPAGADEMFFGDHDREAEIQMDEWKSNRWERAPAMPELGNLCGSSAGLARFYRTLMAGGVNPDSGRRILQPASMKKFLHRWREGRRDLTFLHTVDFGLGVILDSNRYGPATVPYGFGTASSDQSFGHGGFRSSIGFADPAAELVVCLCLIGQVSEPRHQTRMRRLLDSLRSELA